MGKEYKYCNQTLFLKKPKTKINTFAQETLYNIYTDKNNYTDVLECLELRKLALGWYRIDYNNKAEMNFKSGINKILPLTPAPKRKGTTAIRHF